MGCTGWLVKRKGFTRKSYLKIFLLYLCACVRACMCMCVCETPGDAIERVCGERLAARQLRRLRGSATEKKSPFLEFHKLITVSSTLELAPGDVAWVYRTHCQSPGFQKLFREMWQFTKLEHGKEEEYATKIGHRGEVGWSNECFLCSGGSWGSGLMCMIQRGTERWP